MSVSINLLVPAGRLASAAWIQKQTPDVVADSLELCCSSLSALRRGLDDVNEKARRDELEELQEAAERRRQQQSAHLEQRIQDQTQQHEHDLASMRDRTVELEEQLTLTKLQQQGGQAEVRQELQRQLELQRSGLENRIEEQKQQHALQVSTMDARRTEEQRRDAEQLDWFRVELQRKDAGLKDLQIGKDQAILDCNTRLSETVAALHGTAATKGLVGENLVESVFADLRLGTLTCCSHVKASGHADAIWNWDGNSGGALRAMVEVKFVQALHSQKDLAKFWTDVDDGLKQDRVNAAVLISLSARIQNSRAIELKMYHGVPVILASRKSDDSLPASVLVRLAFQMLAEIWPMIQRGEHDQGDSVVQAVSAHYAEQLGHLDSLSRRIDIIDRRAIEQQRDAAAMRKIRDALVGGVDQVQRRFPQLISHACELEWESTVAQELLEKIGAYIETKKRYPKTFEDLDMTTELPPDMFQQGVSRVKKSRKREN